MIAKLPPKTFVASLASGGRRALVGEYDGTLTVWDLEAGKKVRELQKPKTPVPGLKLPPKTKPAFGPPFYSMALSPDGRWAAADNTTLGMLWDITTGNKRGPLERLGLPRFTSDSTQIIGFSRHRFSVWDVKSGRLLRRIPIEGELQDYVLSPQGRWVALAFSNKPGEVWDVVSGKRLRLLDRLETDLQKISPGGKVLVCRLQNGGMRLTSLKNGKLLREIPPRRVREGEWIGFSSDDNLVWFENRGPRFRYYDPASGREASRVEPMKVQR
jgi:WD40 repeat protein